MRGRGMLMAIFVAGGIVCLICPLVGMKGFIGSDIFADPAKNTAARIFWDIRLPRVCLAFLAGAVLSLCGMTFQALFRNALASPFTLGVSSGAALGATVAIRLGWVASVFGVLSVVSASAFVGALAATLIVYGISRVRRRLTTASLLLAGVAVNFFFASLILFVQYTADYFDAFQVLRWTMGGLDVVGFDEPLQVLPGFILCLAVTFFLRHELNLLVSGEAIAAGRGVDVEKVTRIIFFASSVAVGAVVSVCGPVGFVGLMCPHIARLLVGHDHRRLLPASLWLGGAFLVLCDTIARTIIAPTQLPVGIVTAFLGGPFFLWLLLTGEAGGKR